MPHVREATTRDRDALVRFRCDLWLDDSAAAVELGLRSHADGCDPLHPVGFIEGWGVR